MIKNRTNLWTKPCSIAIKMILLHCKLGLVAKCANSKVQMMSFSSLRSLIELLSLPTLLKLIGTAALIVCVLAIVDPFNNPIPQGLEAFTVGFTVLVIGLSMGFNSGYAVNPARDLGPRLFTSIAGWGTKVFT